MWLRFPRVRSMIEIYAQRKGSYYRLFVTGHADYHPGEDIVCAGVSALTGALIGFARGNAQCRHLRTHLAPGEAFLACRGGLGSAFDVVVDGLCRIAASYPDHVRVAAMPQNDDGKARQHSGGRPTAAVKVRTHE